MQDATLKESRILIVDDQPANVMLVEGILQEDDFTSFRSLYDSREVLTTYLDYQPDLIMLDLQMPYLDGFQVMQQLREYIPDSDYLPILILTANITPSAKRRALSEGAMDFITKPFDATEVLLRIKNLLQTRALHIQLQKQNERLDQKVRERTRELEATQVEILERLALAAEYRDDNTGEHTKRVGELAAGIAKKLGWPDPDVELIRRAAPLHDVGKIAVSDLVLLKPARLTPEEFESMKAHARLGAQILSGGRFPLLQMAEQIARTHHERWDGCGYLGLYQDAIPMAGRIVTVADVFDALVSERPYKQAWSIEKALQEIESQSGKQFDPQVVGAFLKLMAEERLPQNNC